MGNVCTRGNYFWHDANIAAVFVICIIISALALARMLISLIFAILMFNSSPYVHDPIFYSLLSVVMIMQHNVIYAIIFISIVYILAFLVF